MIEADCLEGDRFVDLSLRFWIRDETFLRSGPRMTVNKDYFELDGQPLPWLGPPLSSEFQRLYSTAPTFYVWDRDLGQIHSAGLNMIRTGWWRAGTSCVREWAPDDERSARLKRT